MILTYKVTRQCFRFCGSMIQVERSCRRRKLLPWPGHISTTKCCLYRFFYICVTLSGPFAPCSGDISALFPGHLYPYLTHKYRSGTLAPFLGAFVPFYGPSFYPFCDICTCFGGYYLYPSRDICHVLGTIAHLFRALCHISVYLRKNTASSLAGNDVPVFPHSQTATKIRWPTRGTPEHYARLTKCWKTRRAPPSGGGHAFEAP